VARNWTGRAAFSWVIRPIRGCFPVYGLNKQNAAKLKHCVKEQPQETKKKNGQRFTTGKAVRITELDKAVNDMSKSDKRELRNAEEPALLAQKAARRLDTTHEKYDFETTAQCAGGAPNRRAVTTQIVQRKWDEGQKDGGQAVRK
jgi:hypothetical protein